MTGLRVATPKRRTTPIAIPSQCFGDVRALRRAFKAECKRRKRAVAVAVADRRPDRPLRYVIVSSEGDAAAAVSLAVD